MDRFACGVFAAFIGAIARGGSLIVKLRKKIRGGPPRPPQSFRIAFLAELIPGKDGLRHLAEHVILTEALKPLFEPPFGCSQNARPPS